MPDQDLYQYRVWCDTESQWVISDYILAQNGPPTHCPNNTNHVIDPTRTAITSTVPPDGQYDPDGNLLTVNEPRPGEEKYFYLPNLADKCCWYQNATQVTGEGLTTSDDQTFASVSQFWIDLTHGRVFKEDNIPNRDDYIPVIRVNGAPQAENSWGATDNDYSVDYEAGTVTFNNPLQPADVVDADYYHGVDSTFTIEAAPGRRLKVLYTEVQFTKDSEMNSNVNFEIWTYNPLDPATQATGSLTVAALLAAGNTITIAGIALTGVAGARTPGDNDFDASLGTEDALAAEIAAALNDTENEFDATVFAVAAGPVVNLVAGADYIGPYGNAVTLATSTGDITLSGPALTGGAMNPKVLYKLETYKRLIDFFQESTGPFSVQPAFGGAPGNPRGIGSDVYTIPFNYQAYRDLKSSQGTELRVTLDGNTPMGGEFANATFYCLTELE
jgi:hypothetical protein